MRCSACSGTRVSVTCTLCGKCVWMYSVYVCVNACSWGGVRVGHVPMWGFCVSLCECTGRTVGGCARVCTHTEAGEAGMSGRADMEPRR